MASLLTLNRGEAKTNRFLRRGAGSTASSPTKLAKGTPFVRSRHCAWRESPALLRLALLRALLPSNLRRLSVHHRQKSWRWGHRPSARVTRCAWWEIPTLLRLALLRALLNSKFRRLSVPTNLRNFGCSRARSSASRSKAGISHHAQRVTRADGRCPHRQLFWR